MVPMMAFADQSVNVAPPELITSILQFLQGIPKVGPWIVVILKGIAIIAPIMTALSIMAQAILSIPEVAARYSGAHALADKIKYYSDKIIYYLSYFSIRNAVPVQVQSAASLDEVVKPKL